MNLFSVKREKQLGSTQIRPPLWALCLLSLFRSRCCYLMMWSFCVPFFNGSWPLKDIRYGAVAGPCFLASSKPRYFLRVEFDLSVLVVISMDAGLSLFLPSFDGNLKTAGGFKQSVQLAEYGLRKDWLWLRSARGLWHRHLSDPGISRRNMNLDFRPVQIRKIRGTPFLISDYKGI